MTFTAFVYEEDGITTEDLSTYNSQEEAIEFAKTNDWDEVVNDDTGEVVWKRQVKIRYYVSGLGYDENDCITDYDWDFGDFDTYEEAYELFVKLQCQDMELLFLQEPEIYQLLIQLEESEVTDDAITCVDVKNEWCIVNPKFEEDI